MKTLLVCSTLALALFVTGCASSPAKKLEVPSGLPSITSEGGTSGEYQQGDVTLRYASFPTQGEPKGTVVFFPGRTQFVEVYLETAARLKERGFDVWVLDWRGQGLSTRMLEDADKGHIDSFDTFLKDADHFVSHVVKYRGSAKILMGQSMGAGLALRYLAEHPGTFEKAVLGAPLVKLAAGDGTVAFVSWLGSFDGESYLAGEGGGYDAEDQTFEGNPFTNDATRFERTHLFISRNPKLALGAPTNGWGRAAALSQAVWDDPKYVAGIQTPVLILAAEDDALVSNAAQIELAKQNANVTRKVLLNTKHEIFLETDETQIALWQEFDRYTK